MLDSLGAVTAIVLPVFGIVGLGWLAARTALLSEATGEGLADFVFCIAIPMMLFRTVATSTGPEVAPWSFLASYFAVVAIVWLIADQGVRRLFGRDARSGVIAGVSAVFSNLVMVALPFILISYGEEAAVPAIILIAVHLPIMMTAGTILVERAEQQDKAAAAGPLDAGKVLARVTGNLARNPIIIGMCIGAVWNFGSLPMPEPAARMIDLLAAAAPPCALFALGMSVKRYRLQGNMKPALLISALKMLFMPALVWFMTAKIAGLPPSFVAVATICAACPTGINAWLIANRFKTGHAIAANSISLTTLLAVFTMGVWLILLRA